MDGSYHIEFPDLFRLWREHDLADHGPELGTYRPEFYVGLRREDEAVVWRFIEENYLLKYGDLVRVDFDWMADGLWEIPFPGSVPRVLRDAGSIGPENSGLAGQAGR